MSLKQKFIQKYDGLVTGIEEIDIQHEELFDTIKLLDCELTSFGTIWELLFKLEVYASVHFETEEKYMTKFEYPDIKQHIQEHRDFEQKFKKLKQDFEEMSASPLFVENLQNFLLVWFGKHYRDTDIKLAGFLKEKLSIIANN